MEVRPINANALIDELEGINPADYAMSCYETYIGASNALSDAVMRVNNAPTLSLNTLRDAIYQDAVAHGLWEDFDNFYSTCVQNKVLLDDKRYDCASSVHRECDELVEAFDDEPQFSEELADVIIMSLSVAGKLGIDIDAAIRRKMEINKGRAWKHGKA